MAQRLSEQVVEWLTVGGDKYTPQTTVPLWVQGRAIFGTTTAKNTNTNYDSNLLTMNGHMVVEPSYNSLVSYNQGLRINRDSQGRSAIILGGERGSLMDTGRAVWYVGAQSTPNDATTASGGITNSVFTIRKNGNEAEVNTASLRIDDAGVTSGHGLGILNIAAASGAGLSLYGGATSGLPTYGMAFAGTGTYGTHGSIAANDWATYFTMSDTPTRGWIFKRGSTNVASIDGSGNAVFDGNATVNKTIYFGNGCSATTGKSILGFNSTYPNYGMWYFDKSVDVLTLSASGNADSETDADFAINAHGAGTLATRNKRIPHTGNTTGTVGASNKPVYVNGGAITEIDWTFNAGVDSGTANRVAYYSTATQVKSAGNIYSDGSTYLAMVNNGTNNGYDAYLYVENQTSNDWAQKIVLGSANYGLNITGTGTHLLQVGNNPTFRVHSNEVQAYYATNIYSIGSARATMRLRTVADEPTDFWMGSNNTDKWSLTARNSTAGYGGYWLGMYCSNVGWTQQWRWDNGWVNIPTRLGVNNMDPAERFHVVGNSILQGAVSIGDSNTSNYLTFRGITGDNAGVQWSNHFFIGNRHWAGNESSELFIFSGNDVGDGNSGTVVSASGPDRIRMAAAAHVFQTYATATSGAFETVATSANLHTVLEMADNRFLMYRVLNLHPNLGDWREGIRIYPCGGWSTIVLGGTDLPDVSGTSANSWSLHASGGNFYLTRNGSSVTTTGASLQCVGNVWYIYTSTNGYKQSTDGNHTIMVSRNPINNYNSGSAIEIREVNLIAANNQDTHNLSYAPKIGFHWSNRYAGYLGLYDSKFYFRETNSTTRATLDANINGYLENRYQYDGTEDWGSYSWHKVATCAMNVTYGDAWIKWIVSSGAGTQVFGILYARLRTGATAGAMEQINLLWEYAGSSVDKNKFVLRYTNNSPATGTVLAEVWCQMTGRWNGVTFITVDRGNRGSGAMQQYDETAVHTNINCWKMENSINGHGSANYTTGTGGIVSSFNQLVRDYNNGTVTQFGYSTTGMTSTSWLACWDGYNIRALNSTNNNIGALTAHRPLGFTSDSQASAGWGNQTGTGVTTWNDSSGGSIEFRKDNPSGGKVSIKVDGRFYGNEGNNPAMLMTNANGYWGMGDPDANATVWIRTTNQGIIPYESGAKTAGHQSLGTSSWYFANSYVTNTYAQTANVYGNLNVSIDNTTGNGVYLADDGSIVDNNDGYCSMRFTYGLQIKNGKNAATTVSRLTHTGKLELWPQANNYQEGIRIHPYGSWSDITLGGTDSFGESGITANSWFIGNNDGTFWITRGTSGAGVSHIHSTSNRWYVNTTSGGEVLNVGGWVGTVGNVGWYSITHGGGWYMTDSKWIRNYASKPLDINIGANNSYGIGGHRTAAVFRGDSHVSIQLTVNSTLGYGLAANSNGNFYFGKFTNGNIESSSGSSYILYANATFFAPTSSNTVSLGLNGAAWKELWLGNADGAGINYQGTNWKGRVIRFIDTSQDQYGVGISIGGGGYTAIGSGESADTLWANLGYSSGAETMVIGSDGEIQFFPSNNAYDASAKLTMTASRFWAGVNGNTAREAQVGVQSGAGQLYMWSHAATSGSRGIYTPAHGSGGARAIFTVDTNNRIYFADSYTGTSTALAYSQNGLAASAITWLCCWNGYEIRAISKAEIFNAIRDNGGDGRWVKKAGDTMTGQLYINYDQDVGLNQNGALVIGNKGGANIAIDSDEIMARNNSAATTLYLNYNGGLVHVGGGGLLSTSDLTAYGTIVSSTSGTPWPCIRFDTRAGGSSYVTVNQGTWAQIYAELPAKRASDNYYYRTRFFFREYSHNGSGARVSYYEDYYLPQCNNSRTGNAGYNILTSKDLSFSITGSSGSCTGNAATATKLATMSNSTTFYRGDGAWSSTLGGAFTANGTILSNGGYLQSTRNSNTVQIGSQNASYCHITNTANIPFWFNKSLVVDGSVYPYYNNQKSCGTTGNRWSEVCAVTFNTTNYGTAAPSGTPANGSLYFRYI